MRVKRYFNTSGPNMPERHYTLPREELIARGLDLVNNQRYFTIGAPRQTGKSTYFQLLAEILTESGHRVIHTNLENYENTTEERLLNSLASEAKRSIEFSFKARTFDAWSDELKANNDFKMVLIIDEIEGLNPEIFNQFLHTIRNLYHSRAKHCLKSVILVGVSNIIGVVSDNASPFNIADNLDVNYFTREETFALLGQHEEETGQLFEKAVKKKIYSITAGQPGLVNGFAYQLVYRYPESDRITYAHYLKVEDWYLTEAIDKNIANIINKAKIYRPFVEGLLYTENRIPFDIDRESVKFLHVNGLLKKDEAGNIEFWVPIYKKRLYKAFYPYLNGEKKSILQEMYTPLYMTPENRMDFDKLITSYKEYVKRRGFRYFREKNKKTGKYTSIKEAALVYSFETYIQAFLQEAEGKSYLEAHAGAGRSDLIINLEGYEYVVEAKVYSSPKRFAAGKKQLAHYCRSLSITEGIYLVFVPDHINFDLFRVKEDREEIDGVTVVSYLVLYNEEKDF